MEEPKNTPVVMQHCSFEVNALIVKPINSYTSLTALTANKHPKFSGKSVNMFCHVS